MPVTIEVDDETVLVDDSTSLLHALRASGRDVPGLCFSPREGYAARSSCRLCLVELEGSPSLIPACRAEIRNGMVVRTRSARLDRVRSGLATLASREATEAPQAGFYSDSVSAVSAIAPDGPSRPSQIMTSASLSFDPEACIRCGLCRDACQTVQANGVIGIAGRGDDCRIVFELDSALAESTCTSCGECVEVCPTHALDYASYSKVPRAAIGETVCPYCSVGCRITLTRDGDGRVVGEGADGPANKGRLCVKGRFGFEALLHEDRLRVPLVRKPGVPKNPNFDSRTSASQIREFFRPVSWDEALDLAARGLRETFAAHGGGSLAVLGSAKASSEDAYILQKLARAVLKTNHIDHCTRLCASVPPLAEAIGFAAVTVPVEAAAEAEVILMVGSNPEVNHPVAATFLKNAIARGTRLLLVDPYRQPFARHAHQHLALFPGTDVTLLSAMLHVVIGERLYDHAFVQARIDGFEEVAEAVAHITPEIAEKVSGVPADEIRRAARLFATARTAIAFWGMGASQHVHGADNIRCVVSLALICGHVGKPGSGLHPLRGQNNVQGSCDAGLIPGNLPGYQPISEPAVRRRFEASWGCSLPSESGLTVCEILDAAWQREIKAIYVAGGNPSMANPDLGRTREALARLDFLIVQDIFPTETALLADVLLPASAIAERDGTYTSTDRIVQRTEQALLPPGEAMPDWWITREIAQRLGADWANVGIATLFDEMAAHVPTLEGLTFAQLSASKSVRTPLGAPASLFADVFPTATGRARLRSASVRSPGELPDTDYPLVLVTGRLREHWHTGSMTRRSPTLDRLSPRAELRVAAVDFDRMGLSPDAQVRVETRRGRVRVACVRDERLQTGVMFLPFSFYEAAANELTAANLDPTTRVPEYKFCAARVVPLNAAQDMAS